MSKDHLQIRHKVKRINNEKNTHYWQRHARCFYAL